MLGDLKLGQILLRLAGQSLFTNIFQSTKEIDLPIAGVYNV